LGQSPDVAPFALTTDHLRTDQLPCAVPIAAPHNPPTNAWLELDGSPSHQVKSPQMIALSNAQSTVSIETYCVSTSPLPIVDATAVPIIAPSKFQPAAQMTATRGVSTFVETTVAMAFAVS